MMDGARVAEIQAHPFCGAQNARAAIASRANRPRRMCHADFLRGRSVLRLPRERIVVAIVPEMQKASNGHQRIQGRLKRSLNRGWQERVVTWPDVILLDRGQQGEPAN